MTTKSEAVRRSMIFRISFKLKYEWYFHGKYFNTRPLGSDLFMIFRLKKSHRTCQRYHIACLQANLQNIKCSCQLHSFQGNYR